MTKLSEPTKPMSPSSRTRERHQVIGLGLGPLLAVVILGFPAPGDLSLAGWRVAALGLCMAVWWATEALPPAVTALVPIAFFPLFGISEIKEAAIPYAHPNIFLFLGGFMVALAVERWNLHRRIALTVISVSGGTGARLVAGFMVAAAALSMWITNTSTTMMLLPIALSVVMVVQQHLGSDSPSADPEVDENFPVAMLLGVAYGATIGGVATLIGTPPNTLLAAFIEEQYGVTIGFGQWMMVGLPLTFILLPLCWWILVRRLYPVHFETRGEAIRHLRALRRDLGPMSRAEWRIAWVFVLLACGWMGRQILVRWPPLEGLTDAGVAMLAAVALFLIPSGDFRSPPLMDWRSTRDLPWGILLLFGGGLSLAAAVSQTGLAAWLGRQILSLGITNLALLVIVVTTTIIFLTELTSNLATTATFLPVIAGIAAQASHEPVALLAPVALAASCAFMLPVATPPNAVVYGSGKLTIPQMVRAGFWLNIAAILLVSAIGIWLAPRVLG